jgi:hypothetical protein
MLFFLSMFLNKLIFSRDEHVEYTNSKIIGALLDPVLRIRIQIRRIRIHPKDPQVSGLPGSGSLIICTDPDPSINKKKNPTFC